MSYNTVTVNNTATLILSNNSKRQSLILTNVSTGTVFLGSDSSVTIANGIPLLQDGTLTEDSGGTRMFMGDIYGIVDTGTSDVRYWERTR